jgi:hypothetical protein
MAGRVAHAAGAKSTSRCEVVQVSFGVDRNGIPFGCIILIIIPNGCDSGFRGDRPRPRRSATLRTSFSPGHAALAPARSLGGTPGRAGRGRSAPSRKSRYRAEQQDLHPCPSDTGAKGRALALVDEGEHDQPPISRGPCLQSGDHFRVFDVRDDDYLGRVLRQPRGETADENVWILAKRRDHDRCRCLIAGRAPHGKSETTKTARSIPFRGRPPRGQSAPSGGVDATTKGSPDGVAPRQPGKRRLSSCRSLSATPVAAEPPRRLRSWCGKIQNQSHPMSNGRGGGGGGGESAGGR